MRNTRRSFLGLLTGLAAYAAAPLALKPTQAAAALREGLSPDRPEEWNELDKHPARYIYCDDCQELHRVWPKLLAVGTQGYFAMDNPAYRLAEYQLIKTMDKRWSNEMPDGEHGLLCRIDHQTDC